MEPAPVSGHGLRMSTQIVWVCVCVWVLCVRMCMRATVFVYVYVFVVVCVCTEASCQAPGTANLGVAAGSGLARVWGEFSLLVRR